MPEDSLKHENGQSPPDPLASIGQEEDFADGPQAEEMETFESLQRFKVDLSEPIEPPTIALKIQGCPVATLGNSTLLIGKAKSKKSFFTVLAAAAVLNSGKQAQNAITGNVEDETITGELPAERSGVLLLDTEQGKYHARKNAERIAALAGHSDGLHVYRLRELTTSDRFESIEKFIQGHPECGFVVLDGVRDIARAGINDEEDATRIADLLLRLTEEYQIHILTVLHQNKGDFNARGHLGTELVNKSETTISVQKDPEGGDTSCVQAEKTRGKEFDDFAFWIDDDAQESEFAIPRIIENWTPPEQRVKMTKTERLDPERIPPITHERILEDLKEHVKDGKNRTEMIEEIQRSAGKVLEEPISEKIARQYLTHYTRSEAIKDEGRTGKHSSYVLN